MLTFIFFSLHSVNTIFTGANTIYEVRVQHHLCLFESVNRVMCVAHTIYPLCPCCFVSSNVPILQTEIDTHLHVLHINLNANYDSAASTSAALATMRTIFARTGGNWHYTSPSGVKPDLHHALLSRNLGGGIAYVGVICREDYGFGLSASLSGSYRSMSNAVVWDMMVVS